MVPNSQNIQFTTGSGNKYFEIQAPNNAPARYWAIRNTNNCSWLNWNSNPNSNGPINGGQTIQITASVSYNSQGTFSCPAELRIGESSSDLYSNSAVIFQAIALTFVWTNTTID